jgi:hypothetical protein
MRHVDARDGATPGPISRSTSYGGLRCRPAAATFLLLALAIAPGTCLAQADSRSSQSQTPKELSDWLALVLAAEGGVGLESNAPRQPTGLAGVKVGMPVAIRGEYPYQTLRTFTLDLGYDRTQSRNRFSAELSLMLPIVRLPRPQTNEDRNYVRIYAEPGVGYRTGKGDFGGYGSAKVMIALLSDARLTRSDGPPSPFVEIQRRLPFGSPLRGDTRMMFGVMFAVCNHCGLD